MAQQGKYSGKRVYVKKQLPDQSGRDKSATEFSVGGSLVSSLKQGEPPAP